MKKILVINGHPNFKGSFANRAILAELAWLLPSVKVHALAGARGENGFNVPEEQKLLREADIVVFDYPFYWFSVPALLKEWFDEVLTHGFAYGTGGTALKGKTAVFSLTLGAPDDAYRRDAALGYTVKDLLAPLFSTATYCSMKNAEPVYSAGMLFIPGVSTDEDLAKVEARAKDHAERLANLLKTL